MKKRICIIMLSLVTLLSMAFDLFCLNAHAETIKKGIVIENITVELTTDKKDIAEAEKRYGETLTKDAVMLKTVIPQLFFINDL